MSRPCAVSAAPGDHVLRAVLALAEAAATRPPAGCRARSTTPVTNISASSDSRPGAADPLGLLALAADHAVGRLQGVVVDPDFFDGAGRRPHAVLDARALERRAGRASAGDQPVGVAQHRLAVGAHVDEQRQLARLVHPGGEHARADVRADVAGDAGQAIHHRLRMRGQPQLAGGQGRHMIHDRDVRRQADAVGRDSQQQVDHGGVARDRQLEDLVGARADLLARGLQQPVDRADHQPLHLGQPVVPLGVDDAGDHVLAAGDLAVVVGGLRHHLAALQVHQPDGDGRRADVDRGAEVAVGPGRRAAAPAVAAGRRADPSYPARPPRSPPTAAAPRPRRLSPVIPAGPGSPRRGGCWACSAARPGWPGACNARGRQRPRHACPIVGLVGQRRAGRGGGSSAGSDWWRRGS